MDDLIAEFLTETNEGLAELDNALVSLEQNPENPELIKKIFRVLHTIKGTCGFLGLSRLEKVAHKGEDVLGLFRDGKLKVKPEYVSVILEAMDRIKLIIAGIEQTGSEPAGDDSALTGKLEAIFNGGDLSAVAAVPAPAPTPKIPAAAEPDEHGFVPVTAAAMAAAIEGQSAPPPPPTPPQAAAPPAAAAAPAASTESNLANQSLRVSVEVLENLMTMVSELVLTRNQLLQILRAQKETEFAAPLQRLNLVVSDLQDGVMKTRMQPIGNAWGKLPRIIRDISTELGKKIDLEMHGQETELDRQVLELIKDPLTHMVRNSADHGLEKPADRLAAGKPEIGRIVLKSFHEGGHIIIEIADDGKGLPLEKIKQKIIQNGLSTEAEVASMSSQQIYQYIFKAGFSTAEKVTSVSGRGVGMDVVRSNIEKIGGSIELKSIEGKGTTFTIKIPLTLAIVSALIVDVGGERFAVPQLSVRELVMVNPQSDSRIETINGTPVFRLRDSLLPLVEMQNLLGMKSPEGTSDGNKYIIVTHVGAHSLGILVDRVYDTEEIVVKPVTRVLRNLQMFSGNTILGDGQVIMILDPGGILKSLGMTEGVDSAARRQDDTPAAEKDGRELPLLLFRAGDEALKAAPLEMVSRLEEVDLAAVEHANGRMVVQYRGTLMPLYRFDSGGDLPRAGRRPVIVFTSNGNPAGLLVDKILDITTHYGGLNMAHEGRLMGSVIINESATDIINPSWYMTGRMEGALQ